MCRSGWEMPPGRHESGTKVLVGWERPPVRHEHGTNVPVMVRKTSSPTWAYNTRYDYTMTSLYSIRNRNRRRSSKKKMRLFMGIILNIYKYKTDSPERAPVRRESGTKVSSRGEEGLLSDVSLVLTCQSWWERPPARREPATPYFMTIQWHHYTLYYGNTVKKNIKLGSSWVLSWKYI